MDARRTAISIMSAYASIVPARSVPGVPAAVADMRRMGGPHRMAHPVTDVMAEVAQVPR